MVVGRDVIVAVAIDIGELNKDDEVATTSPALG
jgi:hypothetical protein